MIQRRRNRKNNQNRKGLGQLNTEAIIFTGVAIYLVMMLIIGIYASRRTGSSANFIVAGRRMPVWIGSVTIIATWFGGGSMMGGAGASYEIGRAHV